MRTAAPSLLPLFRSEMQVRLLALLILQPERNWTLQELAQTLGAPQSSVHRELGRAEAAGLIRRDASVRPHRFTAAADEPLNRPLAELLRSSVGLEEHLRRALEGADVDVALIHGSWADGERRPGSDVDVLVVGDASLADLRRRVRRIGKEAGRTIDVTVFRRDEFRDLFAKRSSFARRVLDRPTVRLVGDVASIVKGE